MKNLYFICFIVFLNGMIAFKTPSYAQKFSDLRNKAQTEEKAGHYFAAFDNYRQAMLCTDAPKKNDAEIRARACYRLYREQEKQTDKRAAFDYIGTVNNNRAVAIRNNRYYLVDSLGNMVFDTSFQNLYITQSGICPFVQNSLWGLLDWDGEMLMPAQFRNLLLTPEGTFHLIDSENNEIIPGSTIELHGYYAAKGSAYNDFMIFGDYKAYGLMDKNKKILIDLKYSDLNIANNRDWFIAEKNDSVLLIDPRGNVIFDAGVGSVEPYQNGYARFYQCSRHGMVYGLIDNEGNVAVQAKYKDISVFPGGLIQVRLRNGKYGFIDKSNHKIASGFTGVSKLQDENFCVIKNGKCGLIDIDGRMIVPVEFDEIGVFNDSLFLVRNDLLYGISNNKGEVILPLEYQEIGLPENGYAIIKQKNKYGFLNSAGRMALPVKFSRATAFHDEISAVKMGASWQYINPNGEVKFDGKFKEAGAFEQGYAIVKTAKGYGVIDTTGQFIIPAQYTKVVMWLSDSLILCTKNDGELVGLDLKGHCRGFHLFGDEPLSALPSNRLDIARCTFIPSCLADTLFKIGLHLITYQELIFSNIADIQVWADSASFNSTMQFAACAEHNRVRTQHYELSKVGTTDFTLNQITMLRSDSLMCVAAQNHSNNMFRQNFFDHFDPEGRSPWRRMSEAGVKAGVTGENISMNNESIREVIQGWIYSEGHFHNIISPRYFRMGFGFNHLYFTVVFAN